MCTGYNHVNKNIKKKIPDYITDLAKIQSLFYYKTSIYRKTLSIYHASNYCKNLLNLMKQSFKCKFVFAIYDDYPAVEEIYKLQRASFIPIKYLLLHSHIYTHTHTHICPQNANTLKFSKSSTYEPSPCPNFTIFVQISLKFPTTCCNVILRKLSFENFSIAFSVHVHLTFFSPMQNKLSTVITNLKLIGQ